jgi:hypothetical protein
VIALAKVISDRPQREGEIPNGRPVEFGCLHPPSGRVERSEGRGSVSNG